MDGMAEPAPEQRSQRHQGRPAWPRPTGTSDTVVDSVLAGMDGLGSAPVTDHLEIYGGIHDRLLAELNSDAE